MNAKTKTIILIIILIIILTLLFVYVDAMPHGIVTEMQYPYKGVI